jgi:hypothetical protein
MKNSLLSTASGYLNAFTFQTTRSCSNWLTALKAGHTFWLVLFLVSLAGVSSPGFVFGQAADLDQIRNGGKLTPINPPNWVNGNANATQAHYLEGHSIAYRMIVDGLGTNAGVEHTLIIAYDHKKGVKNAIDFITHYQNIDPHNTINGGPFNHNAENIKPLKGLNGAANAHLDDDSVLVDIVAPSTLNASALATFNALPLAKRQMVMYGGGAGRSINAFSAASYSYGAAETQLVIKFHSSNDKVVFAWGGHIATSTNWGIGNSAVFIPGSPYHTRLISIDGKGGNQDRALAAAAVIPLNPPTCLVVGDTLACAGADNMVFRAITDQPDISSYAWNVVNSGGANAVISGATTADTVVVDPGTNGGSFSVQVTITKTGATAPTNCDLEVHVENPQAVASVDDELTCTTTEVQLSGSGGSSYSWTGPNGFTSPLQNPMVSDPGWYFLTVQSSSGTCSSLDSVEVMQNITNITVALGADQRLTCNDDEAEICPSVLPTGINYTFSWTGPNGYTNSDSCITVAKGGGGEYILVVTNGLNGCVGSDTIQVIEDFTTIEVDLGNDVTVNCNDDEAEICPSVLPTGINYTFSWTGPNGYTNSDSCISVKQGGEYILVVTNGLNGCVGSDTIQVIENFTTITVALGNDRTINCDSPTAEICPSVLPTDIDYTFSWTGPNGYTNSDSCITVAKGGAGEYILVVTNGLNGCVGSDTIQVIENFDTPDADAGDDMVISCNTPDGQVTLIGTSNTQGATYLWTTADGNIVSDEATLSPVVSAAGSYILTVFGPNGCTDADTVQVTEDFAKPDVNVGGPYVIACGQNAIQLNGSSTNGVSFEWKVVSGSVIFNASTDEDPMATVSSVSATVRFIVTGANGCIDSADVTITKQVCGDKHCTLTQGAYGNANGKFCGGPRRLELINNLLGQNGLSIGAGTRKIIYGAGDAECIIKTMPAGGTAAALPASFVNEDGCNYTNSGIGAVLTKQGRFNNVFIGQVLTLSLNSRLDNTLGSVVLTNVMTTYKASDCGENATPVLNDVMTRTIPQSVLTYLGANHTVADLLVLANNALGGVFTPGAGKPSISDINAAVSAINEVFDECRILANNTGNIARTSGGGASSVQLDKFVKAYPNPFTDKATIELMTAEDLRYSLEMYDINGRLVSRLSEGTTQAGKVYNFEITAGNLPEGVYLVRFLTDRYIETIKVIYKK